MWRNVYRGGPSLWSFAVQGILNQLIRTEPLLCLLSHGFVLFSGCADDRKSHRRHEEDRSSRGSRSERRDRDSERRDRGSERRERDSERRHREWEETPSRQSKEVETPKIKVKGKYVSHLFWCWFLFLLLLFLKGFNAIILCLWMQSMITARLCYLFKNPAWDLNAHICLQPVRQMDTHVHTFSLSLSLSLPLSRFPPPPPPPLAPHTHTQTRTLIQTQAHTYKYTHALFHFTSTKYKLITLSYLQ